MDELRESRQRLYRVSERVFKTSARTFFPVYSRLFPFIPACSRLFPFIPETRFYGKSRDTKVALSTTPTDAPRASQQADLFPPGLDAPAGFAGLLTRQQKAVAAYLEVGNWTEAARRAGYPNPEVRGAELRKNRKVSIVIQQALLQSGATPERNASRVEQAAIYWHNQSMEAAGASERRAAASYAIKYATLLASIHGKLKLQVGGEVSVSGNITLSVKQQDDLAMSRSRYLEKINAHSGGN